MARTHTAHTIAAAETLGALIATGRRTRRWTAREFAERVGVSLPTLRKVELGDPSVALGTFFEAAVLVGVPLFSADARQFSFVAERARLQLALLPDRVRHQAEEDTGDDF